MVTNRRGCKGRLQKRPPAASEAAVRVQTPFFEGKHRPLTYIVAGLRVAIIITRFAGLVRVRVGPRQLAWDEMGVDGFGEIPNTAKKSSSKSSSK